MATHYLINSIRLGTRTIWAGSLIDDAKVDTAPMLAVGGKLWPSSDAVVAAAAVEVGKRRKAGSVDGIDAIMNAAVDRSQETKITTAQSGVDAGLPLQKKEVTIGFAEVAALGAVVTGSIDVGTVLPAGARLVGGELSVTTKFQNAGDTDTTTADLGTTTAGHTDVAVDGASLKTTGLKGGGTNVGYVGRLIGAQQGSVKFTSDVNLSTLTAGAVKCTLFYTVLA